MDRKENATYETWRVRNEIQALAGRSGYYEGGTRCIQSRSDDARSDAGKWDEKVAPFVGGEGREGGHSFQRFAGDLQQ